MHIDRWLILIGGFTQNEGHPRGLDALWLRLRECSGPTTAVQILPWRHRWSDFAEFIWRLRPQDGTSLDIRVAAYSWGAGHGFLSLAKQLGRRGLSIRKAVLCDPVYHSLFAPWRAVCSPFVEPTIVVPDNVHTVYPLTQRQNRPMGHRVVAADQEATRVFPAVRLNCDHQYADDDVVFHDLTAELFCPRRSP